MDFVFIEWELMAPGPIYLTSPLVISQAISVFPTLSPYQPPAALNPQLFLGGGVLTPP